MQKMSKPNGIRKFDRFGIASGLEGLNISGNLSVRPADQAITHCIIPVPEAMDAAIHSGLSLAPMKTNRFEIDGPALLSVPQFRDSRGFFCERFRVDRFREAGIKADFVQDNFSRSIPGTLRGIHAQHDLPQSKLVTCLSGKIFDVAVDLRAASPTFGAHVSVVLSGDEPAWLWIPAGFGHGFCVLGEEPADILYKVDCPYAAAGEFGLRWNDKELAIPWPKEAMSGHAPLLSPKDETLPSFAEYRRAPKF